MTATKNNSTRKERIKNSPNFKNGSFQNLSKTEVMGGSGTFFKILAQFLSKPKNVSPSKKLPSVKTDLKNLSADKTTLVWFGHSSYLIKMNGKTILVDPVFSGHASPFKFMVKSFQGADVYTDEDLPEIDILLITHDHYDHLDEKLVRKLKPKIRQVVCSLGVGKYLERYGYSENKITELDWWENTTVDNISFTAAPARHFSGRGLKRGGTLWSSFVVKSSSNTLYLGSDSGYDTHFKMIGEKFGPLDLAILESGQYNTLWPQIHMMPEETVQASKDLNAKVLMPVHWGKFTLAIHGWDDPVTRVLKEASRLYVEVATPLIGEPYVIGESLPQKKWWVGC